MNDVKVVVLGSDNVGKSALIVRYLTKRFIGEYASNSDSLYRKRLSVDGRQMNLEIFDPCSQLREGRTGLGDQVQWADGFLIVYDISDKASFLAAQSLVYRIKESHQELYKSDAHPMLCLVGNKQDLCHAREVEEEEARLFALECRAQFCELSAAEQSTEVSAMFARLLRATLEYSRDRRRHSGSKSMAKLINNVFGKRRQSV
ncbi:ras-related and estrogen-regulated growth inhibitor-like protein isoform X2 [Petromyzon marinus]|uniref:small monomeric GTPase n=2 Tax=Petromyzon marinus TaxID=7757 RepID=A0AAJ7STZ0_PETMA|nr:ras-related and estrogen-regulated growth inhibitor-like protein [Petromyzon marinus]XP_061420577.1 ras-related and estrogen-regulated growth inhibitor-like protein isoform X2 [Lethenteron reissneri]